MSDEKNKPGRAFKTLEEAEAYFLTTTRAQSKILATVVRLLIANGSLRKGDLVSWIDETDKAALQRRTPETAALSGLAQLLRQDLGLPEGTGLGG